MRLIVIDNSRKAHFNKFLDWVLYMVGYALILITVSVLFKSLYISNDYFGLWALLAAVIIYVLNKTIKPILVLFTLPITGLTMGLFYPFINVLILYITDFILGSKFDIHGLLIPFVIAILISLMNILLEGLIIKPLLNRGIKDE